MKKNKRKWHPESLLNGNGGVIEENAGSMAFSLTPPFTIPQQPTICSCLCDSFVTLCFGNVMEMLTDLWEF